MVWWRLGAGAQSYPFFVWVSGLQPLENGMIDHELCRHYCGTTCSSLEKTRSRSAQGWLVSNLTRKGSKDGSKRILYGSHWASRARFAGRFFEHTIWPVLDQTGTLCKPKPHGACQALHTQGSGAPIRNQHAEERRLQQPTHQAFCQPYSLTHIQHTPPFAHGRSQHDLT